MILLSWLNNGRYMIFSSEFYKKPKNWVWLILVWDLFYAVLINYLRFPQAINYFNDFACLVLLHSIIMTYRRKGGIGAASLQLKIIVFLFIETIVSYLLNLYRPLTYLWGIRIIFRFMVFFLACTIYIDQKLLKRFFSILFCTMILNVVLTTHQRLAGYTLDSVTGVFSLGKNVIGGSAGLNVFMCIVCTYYFVSAIYKKSRWYKCAVSMFACIYMAAIGELKMFYFELVIILICTSLFSKFSLRRLLASIGGIGVVLLGMNMYNYYYGYKNTLEFASMIDYAGASGKSYGSSYSLNRLTAIPYVWNNILDGNIKKIFGLGAGYADTISSELFSSGFLKKNGDLGFHLWGASLELTNLGIIGLGIYIAFFVSILVCTYSIQKSDVNNVNYYITCEVVVVLSLVMLFYNTSLIVDNSAPFLYFIMAIPFAISNHSKSMASNLKR